MSVIPQQAIDKLLEDYAPDSPLWKTYPNFTQTERARLAELATLDRPIVRALCFRDAAEVPAGQRPIYLGTAGAPAAGKSTLLEHELEANPRYRGAVRTDPDVYAMRAMVNTYHDFLLSPRMLVRGGDAEGQGNDIAQKRAYDVARAWSNVFAYEILNEAAQGRFHIAHGTTMTSASVTSVLARIKETDREIDLLLCYTSDAVRAAAVKQRSGEQGRYQVTNEDWIEKGKLFPQRFPVYFERADRLVLFWRPAHDAPPIRAAEYVAGAKTVTDAAALEAFQRQYREHSAEGQKTFEELEKRYTSRAFA